MKACGLVVEYNPLHNGHIYHIQETKKISNADCLIAIMSGSFLQRGEPAIIDKFYRTKMALHSGVDIVIELPYRYAVQSSKLFAKGAIRILYEIGASTICFGSESGNINNFISSYQIFKEKETEFTNILKEHLAQGKSYPRASKIAYEKVGLTTSTLDLSQPNNILGFSYVKSILDDQLPIKPLTIKRSTSEFHEENITSTIASATSIRKQLVKDGKISEKIQVTIPKETIIQLKNYKQQSTLWHTWEHYFPYLHYRVLTMTLKELKSINGVDEGLEHRLKQTAKDATSFQQWIKAMKTKRYTWTRLQRMFVHILTNTKKQDYKIFNTTVPYIRILGFTNNGRKFLNLHKKDFNIPILTQLSRDLHPMLKLEEKATNAYYSILPPHVNKKMRRQELAPPVFL